MRCAIIKQTTLKNTGPRVINPYRSPNLTFSYLLRIVSQMRNCKNPSSQVCVLKLKMEIIIKKKKIENRNLYSFVHLLFVSHHRIATEFCNGTCSSFASSFSTPVLTRQANMRTRALGSRLSARCGARL